MGINLNAGFHLIIKGKRSYMEFEEKSILMLGKQDVNFNRGNLKKMLDRVGFQYKKDVIEIDDYDFWTEKLDSYDLFHLLGFKTVSALDISDYEGADIILDLSTSKLPENLEKRYDYIFDGGVIEHIFNAPLALNNITKMLKVGGKVIHDLPCGNLIDHGYYSFSPTFLVDYYEANRFYIDNVYLMGYKYGRFELADVISPDCRYNDANEWANTFAAGYNILLVCEATRQRESAESIYPQMQYLYREDAEIRARKVSRYSYDYRIKTIRQMMTENQDGRFAIYGTGITANKMITDLKCFLNRIAGVYDVSNDYGQEIEFDEGKMRVLDIGEIHHDKVQYIICGSEKPDVIDIIRKRIRYLKQEGIQIL